jgi:hypothetical protein
MGANGTISGGQQSLRAPPLVIVPPPNGGPPGIPPAIPPDGPVTSTAPSTNTGLTFYGATPPDDPQVGWLWVDNEGRLFAYIDPGVWSNISTNW